MIIRIPIETRQSILKKIIQIPTIANEKNAEMI